MASNTMNQNHETKKMVESIRVRVPTKPSSSSSPSDPRKCCGHASGCCSTQFMMQNRTNFKRSEAPARFMFFQNGSWVDFSRQVFETLKLGFSDRKPIIDVEIEGSKYFFDFMRMLQIDFATGNQRSIAWIDEDGKCFFPKVFVGDEEFGNESEDFGNPKIEIEIRIDGNSEKRKREVLNKEDEESEVSSSNKKEDVSKRQRRVSTADLVAKKWPNSKLLREGDQAYSVVKNYFLSGLRNIDPGATITAIHQCTRAGHLERARYEVFQRHVEIMKAARGASSTAYAWHGVSAKEVAGILEHGFGVPSKGSGLESYGVGIYLSPLGSPQVSAMLSEADDNGEKHVILCRVILGNVEKMEAGSQQVHPSSVNFDTGVDDLKNPKWYVVWCANMNSHILPECVVSYKSPVHVQGLSASTKFPVAKLFSKMKSSLPPSKVQRVVALYETYKAGRMAKDIFVKQLRSVAGDEVLLSTIRDIRASE